MSPPTGPLGLDRYRPKAAGKRRSLHHPFLRGQGRNAPSLALLFLGGQLVVVLVAVGAVVVVVVGSARVDAGARVGAGAVDGVAAAVADDDAVVGDGADDGVAVAVDVAVVDHPSAARAELGEHVIPLARLRNRKRLDHRGAGTDDEHQVHVPYPRFCYVVVHSQFGVPQSDNPNALLTPCPGDQ